MTKKHFKAIAEIIAQHGSSPENCDPCLHTQTAIVSRERMRSSIAKHLASYCQSQNPAFDRGRFLNACKVTE